MCDALCQDRQSAQIDSRLSCIYSHRLANADALLAVSAHVGLIVACWDTEGDTAAAQPQTDQTHDQEKYPGECALSLINVSHAVVATEMTFDRDWVVRPMALWVSRSQRLVHHSYHLLLLGRISSRITLRYTSRHGLCLHHLRLAHWLHSLWHLLWSILLGLGRWCVLRLLLLHHGLAWL